MADNRDDVINGLNHEYENDGGHVEISSGIFPDPASATVAADSTCGPQLIEWVLANKGVNIVRSQFDYGSKAVNNWAEVDLPFPFHGKKKVPLPNTWIGYAGVKGGQLVTLMDPSPEPNFPGFIHPGEFPGETV